MRRAAKIDANQPEIVAYLRKRGAMVDIVSMVPGLGYDLIVYFMGIAGVVEVKDGTLPPSKRQLTVSEQEAAVRWGRRYYVIETIADCDAMLGEMRGGGVSNVTDIEDYKPHAVLSDPVTKNAHVVPISLMEKWRDGELEPHPECVRAIIHDWLQEEYREDWR